jgi:hypothetical protein
VRVSGVNGVVDAAAGGCHGFVGVEGMSVDSVLCLLVRHCRRGY